MASLMFTHWGRDMDGPGLELIVRSVADEKALERVELDVRDLPERPHLLERMPEQMRARMLWEANELRKGNMKLDWKHELYEPFAKWAYNDD